MVAPEVPPSLSGQTDTIYQTFVFVGLGLKKKEPNVTLKWWNTCVKKVAILILVYLFVNIQMNCLNIYM